MFPAHHPAPAPELVFAVDGGGTKTAARLLSAAGEVIAEAQGGPCNLYQDAPGALAAIASTWTASCARAGLDPLASAPRTAFSAGLAGISAPGAKARLRAACASFARRHLSSDGYVALIGAFDARPGCLLSIGTGVVAHRLWADGSFRQFSGWGFPVGDRGGGAWLGFRAVGDWLEARDNMSTHPIAPSLAAAIETKLGTDRQTILAWTGAARSAAFASLAQAVTDAAQQGDPHAGALLDEATGHLVRLIGAVGATPAEQLVLGGGLAAVFAPRLEAAIGAATFARDRNPSPLHGAWLIATDQARPEFPDID